MNTAKLEKKYDFSSFEFIILCKVCNDIFSHSKVIEKIYIILNELGLVFSENNDHYEQSDEIKIKKENSSLVDYQCIYKEIICSKCKTIVGIFYISTHELIDNLKEKYILFESKLKFYSINNNKLENFRELCFENDLIESNLDHLCLINFENNNSNLSKDEKKNKDFPEFNAILMDIKKAFISMNEGMNVFETRLSQSEQTMETLLSMIEKINKKMHNYY